MPKFLEIVAGSQSGRRIELVDGETLLVGRTAPAQVTIPGDASMSSKHFLLSADGGTWTITDQKSKNGTWLNGRQIETAKLQPGDRVQAGTTEFELRASPTQESLGSWLLPSPPDGWESLPGKGFKLAAEGARSNILFSEDDVPENSGTEDYVANQRWVISQYLPSPEISAGRSAHLSAAGEALETEISFKTASGETAYQRQFYLRRGNRIGILTTTTVETERTRVEGDFANILASARFEPASDS